MSIMTQSRLIRRNPKFQILTRTPNTSTQSSITSSTSITSDSNTSTNSDSTTPPLLRLPPKPPTITALIRSFQQITLHEQTPYTIIDTPSSLSTLLDTLPHLPPSPPSLYLDMQGIKISRRGQISTIQLLVYPTQQTYLIDMHTLGGDVVFHTPGRLARECTLKRVLEDEEVGKVFFDARNDADALNALFGVRLAGVADVQVMEYATRRIPRVGDGMLGGLGRSGSRRDGSGGQKQQQLLSSLSRCVEVDLALKHVERLAWRANRQKGMALFDPAKGGRFEVLLQRPLREELCVYFAQDVGVLPRLWLCYETRLGDMRGRGRGRGRARDLVERATSERIRAAWDEGYVSHGPHKAIGPSMLAWSESGDAR